MCDENVMVNVSFVVATRLVSEKTIEENILKKANEKRLLGNVAIEGGNFTTAFFRQVRIYFVAVLKVCIITLSLTLIYCIEQDLCDCVVLGGLSQY